MTTVNYDIKTTYINYNCLLLPEPIMICAIRTIAYHRTTLSVSSLQASTEFPHYASTLEADSHADTCVAGKNCVPLHYTERTCDVQPYSTAYQPVTGVSIITAATAYTAPSGRTYILIINEALWMPDLPHSLFNPNQFRHYGTTVQDNPYCDEPMVIADVEGVFTACLQTEGTDIFLRTWAPSHDDLMQYPHIVLSSPRAWNPRSLTMPSLTPIEQQAIEARSTAQITTIGTPFYDIDEISRRIMSCATHTEDSLQQTGDRRRLHAIGQKTALPPIPIPGPLDAYDIRAPASFLSDDRHSLTTPEALSERWGLSISQAKLTLKATTRNLIRSSLMPMGRRYRGDRIFHVNRIQGTFATDAMHMPGPSIHGDKYCQVYANKEYFAAAYPIAKKSQANETLEHFVRDYGAMDLLICDGAPEQIGRQSLFQKVLRKYDITNKVSEPQRFTQNPAEGTIREIRRRWYRLLFRTNCPSKLWCYGIPYVCSLMRLTASHSGRLNGRTPVEMLMGETPDISAYLDFGWYDWVWYKEDAGLGVSKIGRFIGVSPSTGDLLSYWILPSTGIPIVRSSVQRVTELEKGEDAHRTRMTRYDTAIAARFNEERLGPITREPVLEDWAESFQNDPSFMEEFTKSFSCSAVPEADDDFDPDSLDGYINMELTIDRPGSVHSDLARVTKRMKDHAGNPIGRSHSNPILDTRMYEVEYSDGHIAAMSANAIAENLLSQVDPDGHRLLTFHSIIDHRTDGSEVTAANEFATTRTGTKRRRHTTAGWHIHIRWHDGTTTWNKMKDVKDSYPLDLADYAIDHNLDQLPAFKWWIPHTLKKRDRIISKTKVSYWQTTHKYGLEVPRNYADALRIDRDNNNTLWQDATRDEMKVARPAFELHEGTERELVGYQKIRCHLVYDVKLGENFRRKARFCANGSTTDTPSSMTFSSVVARDSVRIALTIAALNDLDILVCDVEGAYLTAKCREKIYTIAGTEFGSEQGSIMKIKMALYGLKSSGAAFRAKISGVLADMNFRPSLADPDV